MSDRLNQTTVNQNTTDVSELVQPAVVHERVQQSEREEITEAIDKERHIQHYQQRVQPIADRQVEAEVHVQNVVPVTERRMEADIAPEAARALEAQQAAFRDERTVLPTQRTQVNTGAVATEHVHHHVHETIQPVIERETLQSKVIETTVPIHERIDEAPVVHQATVQPTISLQEFQAKGGSLEGRGEVCQTFVGQEPEVAPGGGADQRLPHHLGGGSEGLTAGATGAPTGANVGTTSGVTGADTTSGTGVGTTGTHTGSRRTGESKLDRAEDQAESKVAQHADKKEAEAESGTKKEGVFQKIKDVVTGHHH
ncbi:hypothetical protein SAICODRAFT_20045 [Saitoella complicata NRRL Y-17804]|nr:uncharacterized protein SAICODRAFT_20045 [Saitoella complicata NRRL Y-17804]ODQ52089.1 hypothetical protein SAICODRAFT_20045 [Saitoella complicata NRRL Y-17804]